MSTVARPVEPRVRGLRVLRLRRDTAESVVALVASFAASLFASIKLLRPDYVQSDVLVHQYWMRAYQDPALFHDPLTRELRGSQRYPDGYEGLFWLASHAIDPVALGEWLGVILMAVSAWLVFRIVRDHASWRPAAWIAAALFLAVSDIHRFYGGFPRAFLHVAVLLTVLLAMRQRHRAAALVAGGATLLYPPAALLSVGVLALASIGWRQRRPRLDKRRAAIAAMAVALMAVLVLAPRIASGGTADVLSAAEARSYPEFGPRGTLPFFVPSALAYVRQNRSGFDLGASGSVLALAALVLLLVRPANIRLLRAEVRALPIISLGAYAVAQLVLFELYLPHRYTYPLLAFFAIAVGVTLAPTWKALLAASLPRLRAFALLGAPLAIYFIALHAFPLGPMRRLQPAASVETAATVLAAVVLAGAGALLIARGASSHRFAAGAGLTAAATLAAILAVSGGQYAGKRCAPSAVTAYLQTLPKSVVIAGDPFALDCIPLNAQRGVVTSTKLAPAYERDYFLNGRARLFAMLRAYYGRSPAPITKLRNRYGATHLWVRRQAVENEIRPEGLHRWRRGRLQPYGNFVRGLIAKGEPAVLRLPASCRRWKHGFDEVYDIECLARFARAPNLRSRADAAAKG